MPRPPEAKKIAVLMYRLAVEKFDIPIERQNRLFVVKL
jgi:hypothetical protein